MAVVPILKRFDLLILMDRSATDSSQILGANAQVDFYRQGATARVPQTILAGQSAVVQVWHLGTLAVGDGIRVDYTGYILSATAIDTTLLSVTLRNDYGIPITIIAGYRLIRAVEAGGSLRPGLLPDPTGLTGQASPTVTAGPTGRIQGYVAPYRFDYVVSNVGLGVPARVFPDAEGSYVIR